MYWVIGLGIGLFLLGICFIMSGEISMSDYSEAYETCTSMIGQGVQFFFDNADQSCNQVENTYTFAKVLELVGIVMAVIGGVSILVGAITKDKRKLARHDTDYYY